MSAFTGLAMVMLLFKGGCASDGATDGQRETHSTSINASDWVELELRVLDKGNYAVLYQVDRDGAIRFGGGSNAVNEKTTWSGMMGDEAYAQLCRLVDEARWAETDPVSTGVPRERVTRIRARTATGRNSFEIKGESAHVLEVRALLETASRTRLEKDLEVLPEPDGP